MQRNKGEAKESAPHTYDVCYIERKEMMYWMDEIGRVSVRLPACSQEREKKVK